MRKLQGWGWDHWESQSAEPKEKKGLRAEADRRDAGKLLNPFRARFWSLPEALVSNVP